MKGEINSNTRIVGDFNNPPTPMDRSTKQKISKETQTLNDKMDQLDLIDIYRTAAAAKSLQSCLTLWRPHGLYVAYQVPPSMGFSRQEY